jgi:tRNA threonylcarbamoyladenosine biosynthesis protein TsaE
MKELTFITHSSQETNDLGRDISRAAVPGDIFCLFGDLGSGKTTFVKGLASGLGIDDKKVHSPTFTLMNFYETPNGPPVFHFDLYRIEHAEEILALDYDEYLYGKGISIIEWADKLGLLVPKHYYAIDFLHKSGDEREIHIRAGGDKSIEQLMGKVWPSECNCKKGQKGC